MLGKSHGWRSLVGYSPQGHKELDTTEQLHFTSLQMVKRASLVVQLVKNPPAHEGDLGSIPGLGRSPGEGKGYPLQYSGLENSTDCVVHGVTKSQAWLSNFHSNSKNSTCNVKDLDLIPGLGRSPGEENGYPLQYSCLENSMDRGAWQAVAGLTVRHD